MEQADLCCDGDSVAVVYGVGIGGVVGTRETPLWGVSGGSEGGRISFTGIGV